MKDLDLTVRREDVIYHASLLSFYVGESRKNAETAYVATKMQASEENYDILNKFADSAIARVTDLIAPYLKSLCSEEEESPGEKNGTPVLYHDVHFSAVVPDTFDSNRAKELEEGIRDALIHYIAYGWFSITAPGEAAVYLQRFNENMADIRHRISQRTKPVRRIRSPF